jgi:hypothetical protein
MAHHPEGQAMWNAILKVAPVAATVITAFVAIFVAVIALFQWKTAQGKLRLDLYNRRLEIYLKVLDFYQVATEWRGTPDQLGRQALFIKATQESRFLFSKSSGVYDLLHEFAKHSMVVRQFEELRPMFLGPDEEEREFAKKLQSLSWINTCMEPLEQKMAPYLDFHKL